MRAQPSQGLIAIGGYIRKPDAGETGRTEGGQNKIALRRKILQAVRPGLGRADDARLPSRGGLGRSAQGRKGKADCQQCPQG